MPNKTISVPDDVLPIIDSTDSEMEADLPELSRDIDAIRLPVRELSATGLTYFAEQADMRRGETADTLAFLAAVTLAVLSVLALVSIVLFRVNRINVQRAATIEMSSRRMATIVQSSLDAIVAVVEQRPTAVHALDDGRGDAIGRHHQSRQRSGEFQRSVEG